MIRAFFLFLASILFATAAFGQVSVAYNAPTYGFNVLAGSVRNINVTITNGTTNEINWSVSATTGSASASLSCTSDCLPEVTVTVGATAGSCSISGSIGSYSVTSTATVTIKATSVDDGTKSASTTFKVCANTTAVHVVPFYRTLYVNQTADLQSWVVGNTNLGVTWSLGSCTGTVVGHLSDTTYRDTVFTGTGTGRCTITATSNADNTKSATAIMYVSGNSLPSYASTPNDTEPVDCSVDAALTGTTYDVGSGYTYATIQSVPINTMPAGSTVRVHNTDTTGMSPTVYPEYFEMGYHTAPAGTATQPMRIVGCPDSFGNLPIVDGNNATGASWVSTGAAAGYGVASVWYGGSVYAYYQAGNPPSQYIIIEGLHLKNARPSNTYTPPSGGSPVAWVDGASCVNIRSGYQIEIIGNEMDNCSNGTFSDSNMNNNAWGGNVLDTLWEGNHIENSGVSGEAGDHQLYIQGWLQVAHGNRVDNYTSGAEGGNFKTRGVGDITRYNYLGDGALRQFDFVEATDGDFYLTFEGYLSTLGDSNCNDSFWCLGDTMGPNVLTGWQEAYHSAFAYGNVVQNSTTYAIFHYAGDQEGYAQPMSVRSGTLYYYNNTLWTTGPLNYLNAELNTLFDQTGGADPGAPLTTYYEFQNFQVANNIYWNPNTGYPYWQTEAAFIGAFTTNLLNGNSWSGSWGSTSTPINGGSPSGPAGNGWSSDVTVAYQLAVPLDPHMTGISSGNFLTTGTQPFNSTTYEPGSGSAAISAGTALSGAMGLMPVRFQYHPDTGAVTARSYPLTIGALDQSASTVATPTFSPSSGNVPQTVTISTATGGATLCYTSDGTTPTGNGAGTCTHGTTYSTPVMVSTALTLEAIGTESGYSDSAVGSATYSNALTVGSSFSAVVRGGGVVR